MVYSVVEQQHEVALQVLQDRCRHLGLRCFRVRRLRVSGRLLRHLTLKERPRRVECPARLHRVYKECP